MGINVGAAAVTAAYLGSTAISSIYLGNTLVFSATPANVVTVNANITAPVTWTAGNIYQVTTDIQITGTNTIVTVEAGAIVEVADGVTITLGPGVGGVGNNTGIDGTGATFRGMTGTDNWRINSSYYGGVFDVTNCSFTGVTLAQLRPRQSSNGRVQINGCLFDRCGGFAGTTYAVDLEPYGAAQNTIVEFANNIFSNTVSIGCIDYSEVQADSILSPAVSGCFFDQNVRVSANSTVFQNNVADAVELNVAMLAAGCTVDGNHLISRSGALNNVDLLNFRANTLVRNNVLFGGIHTVGAFAGYHDNIIRDNVIIAQPGVSNEQIAFPGNNAIIDNNLFLQGGQQASIIFADETGVRIDDNTFVGGTPYNIYLNHTGGAGVAGQVISVEGNAFTGSTIGGMFDEDTFAAAITLIGKNLYTAPSGAYKVQINAPGSEVAPVLLDPGYPAVPAEVSAASWDTNVAAATYRDGLFALYPASLDGGEYLGCAVSKLLDADPDVGGAAAYFTTDTTTPTYFVEEAAGPVDIPAGTYKIELRGKIRFNSAPSYPQFIYKESQGIDMSGTAGGDFSIGKIEDSSGAAMLVSHTLLDGSSSPIPIPVGSWFEFTFSADQIAEQCVFSLDGVTMPVIPFTATSDGTFSSSRHLAVGGTTTGGGVFPGGTDIEYLEVYLNDVLHWAIKGDDGAAAINSDAWKAGGNVTVT